jgi:hypothetical protein
MTSARQDVLLARMRGKKVMVSTADLHYVVGYLEDVTGGELRLRVAGRRGARALGGLVRIHEADPAVAEYVK